MRHLLSLSIIFLFIVTPAISAEAESTHKFDPRTYMYGEYVSDFDRVFSGTSQKADFALIREYSEQKSEIVFMIQELLLEYGVKTKLADMTLSEYLSELNRILPEYIDNPEDKQQLIAKFYEMRRADSLNVTIYTILKDNLQIVRRDAWQADYLTYNLLEPEIRQQRFRMLISIAFVTLVAGLFGMFFFIVYRKSSNNVYRFLLGNNGLQFMTIFVLIIAIIIFGILGVLGGTELAAILSGISGYVLGKSMKNTSQDASDNLSNEQKD